ncbi:MAG: class F420-dependent oxidoreductase [Actinomycetia bacterium]|nr:class F420-dependent oxidoreductase [Actinomycetes bacterium]
MNEPAGTSRYGVTVPFEDLPLHAQRERFEMVHDLGYTDVWSSEADGVDAFTPLSLAAAWAPNLRAGTAIVPAFTRGPAVIAQTAAAMAQAAPAGFACGIGASSEAIVEHWNGIAFDRPYQRTRDLARFLRAAFTGEKVTESYDTFEVRGFRLARPPAAPVPILIAALRPQMLRLAGTHADGAILNWLSAEDVAAVTPLVHAGGPGKEIVARIMVAPSSDAAAVRERCRPLFAAYLNVPGYAAFQDWLGRGSVLTPMWDAWKARERKQAVELVPDKVIDELVVHGTPEECRAKIRRYVEHGVTTPVVAILPFGYDIDAALRDLAP